MSHKRGIEEKDIYFLKVFKVLMTEGRSTLYYILCWGCDRDLDKTIEHYLKEVKKMSNREFNKFFDKSQLPIIKKNPKGDKFDITLLYASIKATCDKLAEDGNKVWSDCDETKLEYILTAIKNFRCRLVHDLPDIQNINEMEEQINELQKFLKKALELGGDLYGHTKEVDSLIDSMNVNILEIVNTSLSVLDIDKYRKSLAELQEHHINVVHQSVSELKDRYNNVSNVDAASFISGRESLKVKTVFTRLDLIKEDNDEFCNETVDYEYLLEILKRDENISILAIEGEAGAGKTTLVKLMLAEWASSPESSTTVRGLKEYDLVLHFECKYKVISTFLDLLKFLLPKPSYELKDNDLVNSVLNLNVLMLVDGLDEINRASKELIQEILTAQIPKSNKKFHVIITTRPIKLQVLPKLCNNQPWFHVRIMGIPYNRRTEFVSRLHEEMISNGQSTQNTQNLVDYLKRSHARLGDHFRLPLNLTLLTYLWACRPERVGPITTATGLYIEFHELIKHRLIDRLYVCDQRDNPVSNQTDDLDEVSLSRLKNLCNLFVKLLYETCFETHSVSEVLFSDDCKSKLENKCFNLKLPVEDMCAAFLVMDRRWTPKGYTSQLAAPHKSILEFYSAEHIFNMMFPFDTPSTFENELINLCKKHGRSDSEIAKLLDIVQASENANSTKKLSDFLLCNSEKKSEYQNVFLHFGGLLAHRKPEALDEYAKELVDLLKQTGTQVANLLNLVTETECNENITKYVSCNITEELNVNDGQVSAAAALFQYLKPCIPVYIVLDTDVCQIPDLTQMMIQLSERNCDVELHVKHQWKDSDYGTSDSLLGYIINKRCRLSSFTGYLENLAVLPCTLRELFCTIAKDADAKSICEGLADLVNSRDIEHLGVHVVAGINPKLLSPLPYTKPKYKECGTIYLSDVGDNDIHWACEVTQALLPKNGKYYSILLPRSNLCVTKCKELVTTLGEMQVKVYKKGKFKLSSLTITKEEEIAIRKLTRKILNCQFHCVDESNIW
ncbi:uncharacterized protein [Procambarus clarkii]|uniref:uncharacterized protein isoform X1 n=1 Tax=Procambarus clarkii TaxID=6728 RepID=UPI003742F02B